MLSKTIMNSDDFLELPIGSRLLYYDLVINADDGGFTNSVKQLCSAYSDIPLVRYGFPIRWEKELLWR